MIIPGFCDYSYENGVVTHIQRKKEMKLHTYADGRVAYKLKDDEGKWKMLYLNKLKALCGIIIELPNDAKVIPYTDNKYFITTTGVVYSFNKTSYTGRILSTSIGDAGYPRVKINYKGKRQTINVHQLMGITFLQRDYVEKGLVCMHKDDDKTNSKLSNLKIGTYSQNLLDAYATGCR